MKLSSSSHRDRLSIYKAQWLGKCLFYTLYIYLFICYGWTTILSYFSSTIVWKTSMCCLLPHFVCLKLQTTALYIIASRNTFNIFHSSISFASTTLSRPIPLLLTHVCPIRGKSKRRWQKWRNFRWKSKWDQKWQMPCGSLATTHAHWANPSSVGRRKERGRLVVTARRRLGKARKENSF